jgi:CarD family transcriptional regulator
MPQKMSNKVQKKSKVVTKKVADKKKVAAKPVMKKVTPKVIAAKSAKPKTVSKPVAAKKAAVKPAKATALKTVVKVEAVKAPVKAVEKKIVAAAKPAVAAPVAAKAAVSSAKPQYKVGVHVVYPTHGVGKIVAEETQMIGDIELRMLVIAFDKDKMTLRVPVHRATAAGLRPVSSLEQMKKVFLTLKSRARTSRGMWSRRAQEYETKINSGNIFFIAEVVRDLHQNVDQSERSYSERMIYESALARLVGELAAAEGTDHKVATDKLMKLLRAKVAAAAALKEAA